MSEKLAWFEVDESSLTADQQKMLVDYRAKQKAARDAQEKFNLSFVASVKKSGKVPDGKVAKVGHNFGKLAIAFADPDAKSSGSKAKFKF